MLTAFEFILYVAEQEKSKRFYEEILQQKPSLDVPGMTEFELSKNLKLGLMPENGIAKITEPALPHPATGRGIPRCELYLSVDNPEAYLDRAIKAGAKLVSTLQKRDWGDTVGYISDFDGHVVAFAEKTRHTTKDGINEILKL